MGTEEMVKAAEATTEVVKEATGLAKFNKFGWGFLAGGATVGAIVGGIFGGKKLYDKHQEKKKATKEKPSKAKTKAKPEPEVEDADFEEVED